MYWYMYIHIYNVGVCNILTLVLKMACQQFKPMSFVFGHMHVHEHIHTLQYMCTFPSHIIFDNGIAVGGKAHYTCTMYVLVHVYTVRVKKNLHFRSV